MIIGTNQFEVSYSYMSFKIQHNDDPLVDKMFEESLKELNAFYGFNWVDWPPRLLIVPDRKTIEFMLGKMSNSWSIGWVEDRNVYVLDRNKINTDSDHTYSPEMYRALIQHELCHAFFLVASGRNSKPKWLWEGVAVFASGQNRFNKRPTEFKRFLDYYEHAGFKEYPEAGFALEYLVKKFSKDKLLELIKGLKEADSKEQFDLLFERIYGSKPTYDLFNQLR